jgi:hypothetical protein
MILYKKFIEDNFLIKNKHGKLVPFILNSTQNYYYDQMVSDYPTLEGVRDNILKFRQPGFSSLIDAIFTVDFILGECGEREITDSDIYSHNLDETKVLFNRVDLFLDSWLERSGIRPSVSQVIPRAQFIASDNQQHLEGHRGSLINVKTAGAKVSGRGGTKQNIHWSEVGFYQNTDVMNAESLVMGAEEQVVDGFGKIFRESTGNMLGDFFNEEYELGKIEGSKFKSRFLGWWLHKEYFRVSPVDWKVPFEYLPILKMGATIDQCYWHFIKVSTAKDPEKMLREYPINDRQAFMQAGSSYFDSESLKFFETACQRQPLREGVLRYAL